MKTMLVVLANFTVFYSAFCQSIDKAAASAATQDSTGNVKQSSPSLTVTGYVEAYYSHDFTAPKTTQERPVFLYNHRRNREVNVNLAFVKVAYTTERVRANLAVQAGTYPQYNYATEQALVKTIYEANVGVKLSKTQEVWLDVGIFTSHIGFESAISKDCWTLTRSLLAENSPYYLAGAKLTYNTPNGKWTLLGSVLNGWQHITKLPGYSNPSFSTQLQYRPSSNVVLNWSTFIGSDRPDTLKQGRFFNNFYALINPTGKLGIILGFDVGADRKPVVRTGSNERVDGGGYSIWLSSVMIARYQTSAKSYVNGRLEYYDDKQAVIIGIPNFQTLGYSLGYDYAIVPNALFRIEGKIYSSQTPIFQTRSGLGRSNASLTTSLAISF